MDFASKVLLHKTAIQSIFFVFGWFFGVSNSAVLLISLLGLLARRYRRRLAAAVAALAWMVIAGSILCGFAYLWELEAAFSSSNPYERFTFFHARFGAGYYEGIYWGRIIATVLVPQLFWLRRCRTNLWCSFAIALVVFLAINYESLAIFITVQTSQDFLPSSWHYYH